MYSNLVTLSEPSQQSIWCYTSKSARSIPTVRISMWPKAGRTWQVTAALGRTYTHSTTASLQVSGFKVPLTTVHDLLPTF